MPPDEEQMTLSVPAAGRLAGLGRNAAYAAARRGQIPTLVIGGRRLVPAERWRRMLREGQPESRSDEITAGSAHASETKAQAT